MAAKSELSAIGNYDISDSSKFMGKKPYLISSFLIS